MKSISLLILFASVALFFAGCSSCPEDKTFFEQNWRHPDKIDATM